MKIVFILTQVPFVYALVTKIQDGVAQISSWIARNWLFLLKTRKWNMLGKFPTGKQDYLWLPPQRRELILRSVDWDLVHQTLSGNIQFDVCERLVPILYRWPGGGGGYSFYSFLSIFVLNRISFSWTINSLRVCSTNYTTAKFLFIIVLHRVWFRVKCFKQGIKNRSSVLNRVRVWGAGSHLPTQGYIEYPPGAVGVHTIPDNFSCRHENHIR